MVRMDIIIFSMKKNIIDIVNKNEFLKRIYPDGLIDIKLGRLSLFIDNKVEFAIHTNQKPAFSPDKWGVWGINYTTIVLLFSGHFLRNIQIQNWQNNKLDNCNFDLSEEENFFSMHVFGNDWDILLELENIIFQSSSVYIDEVYDNVNNA